MLAYYAGGHGFDSHHYGGVRNGIYENIFIYTGYMKVLLV
jgi:hypothetical protein